MISALNTVMNPEAELVQRQLELEETYKIRGIERARKLITDALQNGGIMNSYESRSRASAATAGA
ncbi:hypothetical protein K40PH129C1_LOCUS42 [Klebsiella phage vB_Kpn_K40PH129C1]|uniref:Uncharacterized protein n=1 Tax=Klebsiella phage vB_Kpn_K40PH129C1 TaxID=3071612 RepID=A0AAD2GQ12_9CAUD|nr:hypothetical protein K40PH129C1_LOCUS42 [Klebsiella phage vB_Kpn_K40PH129C1]